MNPQTIQISEYLERKGIEYREQGNELIAHCIFHGCDDDSRGNEAHWYINKTTSQYDCKKCGEQGNIYDLAKHFGDPISEILLNNDKGQHIVTKYTKNDGAENIWQSAVDAPKDFLYLSRKKISPHSVRFKDNKLIVPIFSDTGLLSSIQFIQTDGQKKFLSRGKVAGCFFIIGEVKDVLCIAEGFATAASILEATGHAVAVAFSAGNLKSTAQKVAQKYPKADLIICADTDENGLLKAKEATETVGGRLAIPQFDPSDTINDKAPTDFNDLWILKGKDSVISCIGSAEKMRGKYQFTSLYDLLGEPEEIIDWIVEGLLPHGGFSIVVAKPKVGKSTIARQLALCVANGTPFLNKNTNKGRVLYVSLEEKRSEVRNHFRLLGATGDEDIGLYIDSTPENAFSWLQIEIERTNPVLVIIDTLFRFTRVTDVNDYAKMIAALDPLLSLARSHSVHLMGVHHARKGEGQGADTTLGSTAIFGSVDTAIVLKKQDNRRTIETQQRYGTDMEPTVLNFDQESKRAELGETKQIDDTKNIEMEILDFLVKEAVSVNEERINAGVEGKTTIKRRALRNLVSENRIVRSGPGVKGNPYTYSCSLVPGIYVEQEKQ